ncbi:MAG: hypothetical protein RI910_1105 [Verrucomicrobiota bacterium]|jgi:hypothetical protein
MSQPDPSPAEIAELFALDKDRGRFVGPTVMLQLGRFG